jgi:uncharacterized protein
MRIFFDTNVIISAFITHGHASELFNYCLANHKNYTSDFVIAELEKNLIKFNYSKDEVSIVASFLSTNFSIVSSYNKLENRICRDEDDDNILAAACKSKVDCIITGDKDLLILKEFSSIPILSPRDFWSFEKSFK